MIAGSNTGLSTPYGIALDRSGRIYVANIGGSVTVFAAGATGNAAPAQTITGSNTGLDLPTGIALDAAGRIYVASSHYPDVAGRVTVFASAADGNVSPVQTIEGKSTGLEGSRGIAVSGGFVYVSNSHHATNSVTVYPSGTNGNVAPARTIAGSNTGMSSPDLIAVP
ncbi:MAG: hypothetical protein JOZ27_09185 [Caulobacteraceae bacterium]|nr:hypothetical protein [Caulobacteraceae bacterium]